MVYDVVHNQLGNGMASDIVKGMALTHLVK